MEVDITNFLLKYPNIDQFDEDKENLNPYDEDFYNVIYKKKEFYDNRLDAIEEIPKDPGSLMKHQKLIARFFSSYTLYDELLLLHEMGSGKSCSAIGAVEQIKKEGLFRGVLYLAKGDALINNFINELIFKCTDGRYIPEDYTNLTELEKVHRKKKAIKDYYRVNTFETFAKKIKNNKGDKLIKLCENEDYNNHIIIIDEVHNLRMKTQSDELDEKGFKQGINVYNEFWRFLHTVKDCKILLLSGTPMKDGVDELASVMNLILPISSQLPTGLDFENQFFEKTDKTLTPKLSSIPILKQALKGRVSYLKSMQSTVNKVFFGNILDHLIVAEDKMSDFQTKYYKQAVKEDGGDHKGVWVNARQASLFVFPNGTWGKEGFATYIKRTKINTVKEDGKDKKNKYFYSLGTVLRKELKPEETDTEDVILTNLERFSSKYATSIRTILKARSENKSVFIYNEFVSGSGLILFGAILELFKFSKASGSEAEGDERPRYATLTSETSTDKQINKIAERFNKKDNMHGKIINVIIGSRKISEGFTFKNVQIEDIHTPWFNYSETSQVIARGYRLGSHQDLLVAGIEPLLTIYQRVSIPKDDTFSIDVFMYKISEEKDVSIKRVERIMKEAAWDCGLTYNRNYIPGLDNKRECDYTNCEYVCDGPNVPDNDKDLNYSTFYLQYNEPNIQYLVDQIIGFFHTKFRTNINTLVDYLQPFSKFEIISALCIVINKSKKIINKYGFTSYLKEENNMLFLVDSLSSTNTDYYTEHPTVVKPKTFEEVVEPIYIESLPPIINQSCNAESVEDIRKIMIRLPIEVREYFIENSIIAKQKGVGGKIPDFVLEYFINNYAKFDDTWVSWLLDDSKEILRCFDENDISKTWKNCDESFIEKIEKYKLDAQKVLETNPSGFYGLYNPSDKKFCIRDVKNKEILKGNQKTSGVVCTTIQKVKLLPMILDTDSLNLPIPTIKDIEATEAALEQKKIGRNMIKMKNFLKQTIPLTKLQLLDKIEKNDLVKSRADSSLPEEELRRIYFWSIQVAKDLCAYLHIWFEKQGRTYFTESAGCGSSSKVKPK